MMSENLERRPPNHELQELIGIIELVSNHIRSQELSEIKLPEWYLSSDQISSKWVKRAHQVFTLNEIFPKYFSIFPVNPLLLIATLLAFALEPFYAPLFGYILRFGYPGVFPNNLILGFFLTVLLLLLISGVFGTYWSIYEILINRKISFTIKGLIFSILIAITAIWVMHGAPIRWENWDPGNRNFYYIVKSFPITPLYRVIAGGLFYFPIFNLGILFIVQSTIEIIIITKVLLTWFFKFQIIQSSKGISQFLEAPLPYPGGLHSVTFLELGNEKIDALKAWAESRRETVN